ncbi:MAG: hypothetical protein WBV60_15700 [Terriglobales bacterium]
MAKRKNTIITVCGKDMKVQGRIVRIARLEGEKHTFPDDPEAVIDGLRKSGPRADIFTFLQRVSDTSPKYSYRMEYDNLAVLPVSTFESWWNHQIRSYPRNRARQAEKKGVIFREVPFGDVLIRGICGIYNETPVRQGKAFPHYGMTPEQCHDYAGTFLNQSIYIGAFLGDMMIGFVKLVMDESRTQACMVHILSMVQHNDKAPTNALIAQAVRSCAENKIPYLVYEHFHYGNKQGDSLSHFKEVNGFERVDVPRYYVPITNLGQVALQLGLHHRLVDCIPESVAAKLRDWRKAWYRREVETLTES